VINKSFLLFVPLFLIVSINANSQKVDSLIEILKVSRGVEKYEALYGLAYEYSDVNDSLSLIYASQAYDAALKLNDSTRIVKAGRIKAGEQRRTEKVDQAIQTASYVLSIARRQKEKNEIKLLLNSLANSYFLKAEYDKALTYHFESLVIREAEDNKAEISIALNNIGLVYYKLHDYNRAVEYYKKSLEIKRQVNDHYALDNLLINLGLALNSAGLYREAIKYINDGLKVCGEKCSDQITLEGEIALGISLLETNLHEESLSHFEKSFAVAKRIGNQRYQAENQFYFARVSFINQDYSTAVKYLKEAETISVHKGYRFLLITIYDLFSKVYKKTDDYKNTAFYQSKYITLKDSILSDKVISNLTKVRTAYEERENIKTIAEKDQVLTLQQEVITRQQRQYYFIVAIACLVVALAFLSFYFSKRQQKANKEISKAKNLIQEQKDRLETYSKELENKVEERTSYLLHSNDALHKAVDELDYFIYKSSHDIRGPLATLKGMSSIALRDLKDPLAIEYFRKFDITTDKLNVTLTRLQMVNYVTHSPLKPERIDFKSIIEDIIAFEKRKGTPDHFSFSYEIAPDCEITSDEFLVRTILENLIDNGVKFRSGSDRINPFVKLKLSMENQWLKVIVEDNGIGIGKEYSNDLFKMFVRASEQSEIGGVGLYLIKLAIDKAGGKISLVRSGHDGSVFEALFPPDLKDIISVRNKKEKSLVDLLEKPTEPTSKS
jgi:signal transduction histidine kinase